MKPRILFCTHEQFWPLSGGGTAGNYHLIRQLTDKGFDVTVSCPFYSDKKEAERIHRVAMEPFSPFYMHRNASYRSLRYLAYGVLSTFHLARLLTSQKYDLVIVNNAVLTWPMFLLRPFFHLPVVLRYTDFLSGFLAENKNVPAFFAKLLRAYETRIPAIFDQVFVITERMKQALIEGGNVAGEKIFVVYDGVDTRMFNPSRIPEGNRERIRHRLNIPQEVPLFMYHGMVEPQNGAQRFPEIIERIKIINPLAHLLILGTGRGYTSLRDRYRGDTRVHMLDFVPYHEVPLYIDAADAGFIPYPKIESMNLILTLKLLEYLALGTPCAAFTLDGIKEVFGYCPFVGLASDAEELARRLKALAAQGKSAAAARIIAEQFTWDSVAQRMIDNFSTLISSEQLSPKLSMQVSSYEGHR